MSSTIPYSASCHCGAVTLIINIPDLTSEPHPVVACNCSICTKHALAMRHCQRKDVRFTKGEEELKEYLCGGKTRRMRFCGTCAVVVMFDALRGEEEPEEFVGIKCE